MLKQDFHLYLINIHEKIGTKEKVRIIEKYG